MLVACDDCQLEATGRLKTDSSNNNNAGDLPVQPVMGAARQGKDPSPLLTHALYLQTL